MVVNLFDLPSKTAEFLLDLLTRWLPAGEIDGIRVVPSYIDWAKNIARCRLYGGQYSGTILDVMF
jgi:hypothetical protein